MTEKELKELLDKFLKGKTTPDEERILYDWEESNISRSQNGVFKSDIEKWQTKQEIYSGLTQRIGRKKKKWLGIAASIAVLIGVGTSFLFNGGTQFGALAITNGTDSHKIVKLVDGSKVTLNKKSGIRYKNNYNGTRYLELEGEAFFEIARDEKKPFVVKTGRVKTIVLGTSFNIREAGSLLEVTVATGLVEVSDDKKSVQLKPNQRASYSNVSKMFTTQNTHHELSESWFKESIKLEKIEMGELAEYIKQVYGVQFQFVEESAKQIQMSINIHRNEDLDAILWKINYISELQLTKNPNNMIHVKFKG